MMKILVVDDHAVVRRGFQQFARDAYSTLVLGEAQTAEEALDLVRRERWDLVVMDINLPGRSGLDILRDMKRERPGLPVVIYSMHPEQQYAVRAFRAGASGYVAKASPVEELFLAIRKVMAGGRYVSPWLAERLAQDLAGDRAASADPLSEREHEVLRLIASGRSAGDIAENLHLSVKTVSTYRARALEKLGLRSNAELVRYALEHRLVS
jgi:DNA-binding NarL/FixJ family response regulator